MTGMKKIDPDLIVGTIDDLDETLEQLRIQREMLEERINETLARQNKWKSYLVEPKTESHPERNGKLKRPVKSRTKKSKKRLRKGEALKAIAKLFKNSPGTAYSLPEIANLTGISWSTVRNVMKKPDSGFSEKSGAWYKD
jgi:DNA-binding NarL/FixJ family response regulator